MATFTYAVESGDRTALITDMTTLNADVIASIAAANNLPKYGISAQPAFTYLNPYYSSSMNALLGTNTVLDGVRTGLEAPSWYINGPPQAADLVTFTKATYDLVVAHMNTIFDKSLNLNLGANPARTRATAVFDNLANTLYYDNNPSWITEVTSTGYAGGETLHVDWIAENHDDTNYKVQLYYTTAGGMASIGNFDTNVETYTAGGTHAYTITSVVGVLYSTWTPLGNIEFQHLRATAA